MTIWVNLSETSELSQSRIGLQLQHDPATFFSMSSYDKYRLPIYTRIVSFYHPIYGKEIVLVRIEIIHYHRQLILGTAVVHGSETAPHRLKK